jgi:VWFA-related protein
MKKETRMKRVTFASVAVRFFLAAILSIPAVAQSARRQQSTSNDAQSGSQTSAPSHDRDESDGQDGQGQRPRRTTDDPVSIKVDTTLVSIPVSVVDKTGRSVPRLTKQDFHIYEDGVEQEIADLTNVEAPFHVVLLLDTSRSTVFKIEDIHSAAASFVNELRPNDKVMVVSFDRDVYIDSEFTSDRDKLRRAIYGTRTGGETRLYDAVDLVITERLNRIQGRKAIVLFTDGEDTASRLATDRSTLARVEESGVLVYPIQYDTGGMRGPYGRGRGQGMPPIFGPFPGGSGRRWPFDLTDYQGGGQWPGGRGGGGGRGRMDSGRAGEYLRNLSERSGARLYHAETIENVSNAFTQIANDLRQQYALSYYPSNTALDGSYRRINVRVNRPDVVVRAREGYRAGGKDQAHNGNSNVDDQGRPTTKQNKHYRADN